ncbi:class I SAM-dependent methyltransferase [Silicimonas algicola]|uniref:Putative nicotinamide N-methyase n=1 Tax=Silicimonas algicola TaxID=1826607 RepID=A0A316G8B6_9RHOB|nr:50S ribosomal protein L11 methyltransferase [Silicimonas algicola]PWK57211.1 putative nicotinamide N-methyase [Silicimonas algicola]
MAERPDLLRHTPHPGSGLAAIARAARSDAAPYWAHLWPGGAALILHLQRHPETVAGQSVLDLGAGAGLVGIAAARAGASHVTASDIDPLARLVAAMNAEANGTPLALAGDLLDGPAPDAQVILAGDVFYSAALATRVLPFLHRCHARGARILVGDLGRAHLPRAGFDALATYPVRDLGDPPGATRDGVVLVPSRDGFGMELPRDRP